MTQVSMQLTDLLGIFEPVSSLTPLTLVQKTAFRLDAGSYADGSIHSVIDLTRRHTTSRLDELANVFGFGPFKRTYVASGMFAVPLLSSSEMMQYSPEPPFLSQIGCPKWKEYLIERGWLLLSCSGTIGNLAIVPRQWHGWAVSQHAIRIVPRPDNRGLLYSFLQLPAIKDLLLSKRSGSVIDEIYANDVAGLECPNVAMGVKSRLNNVFDKVLLLREEAHDLIDQVLDRVLAANELSKLSVDGNQDADDVPCMTVRDVAVYGNSEHRLDAHFYNPTAQQAVANIRKCREVKTVGEVARRVFFCNRFTRTFVDSEHGVPYLAGKNIVQMRPTDLAYLSKSQTVDFEQYRLQRGWILMTCSGTIGRTCMVWKNFEEYVGTHDLIRLVPDEQRIDGGYLYAFLSSDYGKQQVLRYRHGSVIDHVTPEQVQQVLIPLPSRREQTAIGDKVRDAYDKRAEAIRLEDEAQAILMKELTKVPGSKGV